MAASALLLAYCGSVLALYLVDPEMPDILFFVAVLAPPAALGLATGQFRFALGVYLAWPLSGAFVGGSEEAPAWLLGLLVWGPIAAAAFMAGVLPRRRSAAVAGCG